jgi:hypothetical protein
MTTDTEQIVSNGNALGLYLGGALFESRLFLTGDIRSSPQSVEQNARMVGHDSLLLLPFRLIIQ